MREVTTHRSAEELAAFGIEEFVSVNQTAGVEQVTELRYQRPGCLLAIETTEATPADRLPALSSRVRGQSEAGESTTDDQDVRVGSARHGTQHSSEPGHVGFIPVLNGGAFSLNFRNLDSGSETSSRTIRGAIRKIATQRWIFQKALIRRPMWNTTNGSSRSAATRRSIGASESYPSSLIIVMIAWRFSRCFTNTLGRGSSLSVCSFFLPLTGTGYEMV